MVKVGVQTKGILPEMGIEDGVAIIAQAGFEMVDFNLDTFLKNSDVYGGKINKFFDADIEDILAYFGEYKKMFNKYGIKPSQMHAPYPMYVLGRDDISQYMQNVVIPKSIQIAGFLEIPWVVMHPFKMQYKYGLEAEQAMNIHFISSLIPELKKHNVRICVENLYESVGGRITEGTCADPDDAIFYVDMLNMMASEERFGICLDTGHIQLVHRQPADYIRKVGSRLKLLHMHENDAYGDKSTGKAPEFAVITVETTTANLTNSYPATIKGKQDVEIRPMVSGFITKLHVDEGSVVHKGQVLFSIDPVQYQAAVNSAKAAVETAKAAVNTQELTVSNKRTLNQKNIISDYDLQMAENQLAQTKAQLAQAEAQLINAQNNLSYTSVTSPSDGIVGTIPYRVGSLVSPSMATPLTTVADISEMFAYFSMTERQLLSLIREGGSTKDILAKMPQVQLQLIDGTMYADSGRVETISGVIDQTTGAVNMRALFPNKHNILRSGGTGNVVFPNPMENVIMIPQSATTEIQDKKFVFVAQPDNTLKNTEIQVFSLNDGKYFYVTDGLKAGDKIVIEGVQNLKDGQSITPITPEEKEAEYQKALKDQKEGNIQTAFN